MPQALRILHVIPSVNPQSGGPIEGVNQLSEVHRTLGVTVEICSLDAPDDVWVINSKVKVHALGPVNGTYGYSRDLVPWLKTHAHEYDAVIVNGLWQYVGFAVRRALVGTDTPYFVFSHGMLGPWFKHTYPLKHLKKWLYWPWAEYRVLRDARRVIFTCDEERILARESFWLYKVNESVGGFGVSNPPTNGDDLAAKFLAQYPHLEHKRIVLFLGRMHEVKGCDLLIDGFSNVAAGNESLHLVMAGPDRTGFAANLKVQAEALGVAHRITWTGMLTGDIKWGAIYASEVFCLPSHHENFGVVVAEALACGKPVLISNKVNIWREIEADGAGLVEDDTQSGADALLSRWLNMSSDAFASMKSKTIPCFQTRFHVEKAAARLLEIIREGK